MPGSNAFVCTDCGNVYPLDTRDWRCACGGLFDLGSWPRFDAGRIDAAQPGLWRYRTLLPLDPTWEPVTLGEGSTPLLMADWDGWPVYFKLESVAPTGSFKDWGAAVLVAALRGLGVGRVVEDSSGNAGASLAAYAGRAGIECEIHYQTFVEGRQTIEPVSPSPTVASGIAIGQPVRGAEILVAVRASEGAVVRVGEEEIKQARDQLARRGFYVEETSAVAVAAVAGLKEALASEEPVVVPLTGHGLKTYQTQVYSNNSKKNEREHCGIHG